MPPSWSVAQYGYPVGDWPAKNQSVHKHLICVHYG
jgi:hypothetical protein